MKRSRFSHSPRPVLRKRVRRAALDFAGAMARVRAVAQEVGGLVDAVRREEQELKSNWRLVSADTRSLRDVRSALAKRRARLTEDEKFVREWRLASNAPILSLSVGGGRFATRRGTLTTGRAAGSMLSAMFSGRWNVSVDPQVCFVAA